MSLAVGVDVGASKVAAAVVDVEGGLRDRVELPTPVGDVDGLVAAVAEVAGALAQRHGASSVGVGAAAYVDRDRSRVLSAPNLPWADLPLRRLLSGLVGLPVVVENDGNAAAWGEHRFGAGRGCSDLLLLTVGTGVGGGVVQGGRLLRGAHGVAAEVGHLRLVPDGEPCGCGARGCLEAHASGTALVRRSRALAAAGASGAAVLLAHCGGVAGIDGPAVSALAAEGDPFCRERLAEVGRALGEALASLTAVLDPGVVVVGGGVADAGELVLGPLRTSFEACVGRRPVAQVRPAALGRWAGVAGAAELSREQS